GLEHVREPEAHPVLRQRAEVSLSRFVLRTEILVADVTGRRVAIADLRGYRVSKARHRPKTWEQREECGRCTEAKNSTLRLLHELSPTQLCPHPEGAAVYVHERNRRRRLQRALEKAG